MKLTISCVQINIACSSDLGAVLVDKAAIFDLPAMWDTNILSLSFGYLGLLTKNSLPAQHSKLPSATVANMGNNLVLIIPLLGMIFRK